MYSLSKGVISKYIRGECKRRLRLDLYEGKAARVADEAVEKDAKRPGLTLLSEQGRSFERQCFRELDGIFRPPGDQGRLCGVPGGRGAGAH